MEANIIVEGFQLSEQMHGVRYLWFIGDGGSSVYHSVVNGVPSYGRCVQKDECANHAVNLIKTALKYYVRTIQNIKDGMAFLQ